MRTDASIKAALKQLDVKEKERDKKAKVRLVRVQAA
jgi:hypothetical protein